MFKAYGKGPKKKKPQKIDALKEVLFQLVSKNEQSHAETCGVLGHDVGK